jgi:radical SAM superfamily enzyme YgiQ (UPF0313 family)
VVRIRSTDSVLWEIESVYRQYGFTGYMFYDDELNVNPRFMELLDGLVRLQARLGTQFHLRGFVKAELFTRRHAAAMYAAGFRWILSGFETGSPRILENINKRATRDDNSRCIGYARECDLKVKALMSLGHPGESPETVAQTREWLLGTRPDDADITIITPYPGTSYYDRAVALDGSPETWMYTVPSNGDRLYSDDIDYNATPVFYKGDPAGGYRSFTRTDYLSAEELVEARNALEKEVRTTLGLPHPVGNAARAFEHSMGQCGGLPDHILRSTQTPALV